MKTISLKKVSAVAVASLGFGLLSVVPAQAAATANTGAVWTNTDATLAANQSTSVNTLVGVANTLTLKSISTAGAAGNMDITMTATLPANAAGVTTNAITTGVWGTFVVNNANSTCTTPSAAVMRSAAGAAGTHGCTGTYTYTPNVPGIYVLTATLGGTEGGTVLANGSITHKWTIYAGYQALGGSTNINRAFPVSGSNITTGWTATAAGQPTVRISGLTADTEFFVTVNQGALVSCTGSDAGGRTGTVANTNGTNLAGGCKFTTATTTPADSMDIRVTDTGSVATTTITVASIAALTAVSTTFVAATVTYGVAAAPSAQYSTLGLNALNGTAITLAANDTTATTVAKTANTQFFNIMVAVRDQYDVAFPGFVLSASMTGPGSLGLDTNQNGTAASTGRGIKATLADHAGQVSIYGDGTSGTTVVTIIATTAAGVSTVIGTKTVKFAGSPSKATVTQNLFVAKAGTQLGVTGSATNGTNLGATVAATPAFTAVVADSAGVPAVAGSTVKMTSSDATVIVVGTCVETITANGAAPLTYPAAPGNFECSVSGATSAVSGKTATVTFSVLNSTTGLYDIVATPITFTIGGSIAKSVISADKATYTAGEALTLSATSTDSSANKAYDGQTPFASVSSNKGFGGTNGALALTAVEIRNGKYSTTSSLGVASVFAPSTPGSFTISGLYTDAGSGTAYSVSGSVNDNNAALLTQIDALNAKIVALNALIAKIMKKLGVK